MTTNRTVAVLAWAVAFGVLSVPAAGDEPPAPPAQSWSFSGPFGMLDKAAARRGFQVYSETCANCHAMQYLHYRDLAGLDFSPAEITTIASAVSVPSGVDAQGAPVARPATPASMFRAPFPSDDAARAAFNGALPPDLSLSVDSFAGGPDYVYALLTGYGEPPAGAKLADGMSFNAYFAGHQIAMPPPLAEGQIAYADKTPSTVAQNARDVVTFLSWAANPEMDQRKRLGPGVILYGLAMSLVTFLLTRRIWARVS
jgi:ubiquinol-cytochrome c reductase cytochrome c1 subunit